MSTSAKVKAAVTSTAGKSYLARVADLGHRIGAAVQHDPSAESVTVAGRSYYAQPGGMCERQARQLQEAALGLPDHGWSFAAASAKETEAKLKAAGRAISGPVPGALLFFDDGDPGHVVTYLGAGVVLENTSSAHRGNPARPGTKVTPLADVVKQHGGAEPRFYYGGKVDGE